MPSGDCESRSTRGASLSENAKMYAAALEFERASGAELMSPREILSHVTAVSQEAKGPIYRTARPLAVVLWSRLK